MGKINDDREALLRLLLEEGPEPARSPGGRGALSFSQKRIWFLRQLLGDQDVSYNVPFSLRLRGQLDRAALTFAVNEVVARHDILRARFELADGQPAQYVAEALQIDVDLLAPPTAAIASVVAGHARHVFDLASAPLLKVSLIRIAEDDHILLLNMHHIVADGWSLGLFVKELSALYRSAVLGDLARLPKLELQYSDFAEAQADRIASGAFDQQLHYWLKQLKDGAATITLPTDSARPESMSGRGGQVKFVVARDVRDQLRDLAAARSVTLFMLLMSAYLVLLHRLGGDEDLTVGTPVAGRPDPAVENLIGCFVNTVVIRASVRSDDRFEELLERVKLTSLAAFENQDVPFELVVEHLAPARSLGQTPVFQAMLALQNIPLAEFDLPGVTIEPFAQNLSIAKFDLNLNLSERATGISAILEYNSDIFEAATIEQIATGFKEVLTSILSASTSLKVSEISAPSLDVLQGRAGSGRRTGVSRAATTSWSQFFRNGYSPSQLPRTLPSPAGDPRAQLHGIEATLDRVTSGQAHALARRHGVSAFDVMLAALLAVNLRFVSDADAVIGVCEPPEWNPDADLLDSVWWGLHASADGEQTFADVLHRTAALRHEWAPSRLSGAEVLKLKPSSGRDAACFPISASRSGPVAERSWRADLSPFHLTLAGPADAISVIIQFDSAVFSRSDAEAIRSLFLNFAQRVLADPDTPISEIPLLHGKERDGLLSRFRGELIPSATYASLAAPFEAYAREHCDAVALVGEDSTVTYGALDRRSTQLARYLRKHGVREGSCIAVCMQTSTALVEALYAIAKTGAAYAPIDGEFPPSLLAEMLGNLAITHVLTDEVSRERVPSGAWAVVVLEACVGAIADEETTPIALDRRPGAACYVMHTSGSSGRPKAVQFPSDLAIMSMQSLQARYPVEPGDVHLFKTPFTFDVSIWEIFWPLYHGGRLVIMRPGGHRDPACLRKTIEANGVTLINIVPSMLDALLGALPRGACPSVKWVFSGGERLSPAVRDRCFETLPQVRLANLYGPTETHAVADIELSREDRGDYVPIGVASSTFQLYLLDDNLEPVPMGVPGELFIGNPAGLAHGYVGQSALTAERFIPDPFGTTGSRLYRTGDLCRYYATGELEFVSRRDRQLKVAGIRIEPAEVERAFLSHPSIAQCVVTAVGDTSDRRLIAYVVPEPNAGYELDVIRRHVAALLPRHLSPSETIAVQEIPKTPTGKADLARLGEEWARQRKAGGGDAAVSEPATVTEDRVRRVFEEVLNRSGIDLDKSFFDVGGHSLMAIQLITRCEKEFAVTLPLPIMYTAGSVQALAAKIDSARDDQARSMIRLATSAAADTPAIILVHGAEGTIAPLVPLAQHLGAECDVFALQAPGIDSGAKPCPTIASYVEYYLPLVKSLRETREIVLVGWSFGGNVAVEVARQLEVANLEPLHVILLDSFVISSGTDRGGAGTPNSLEAAHQVLSSCEYPGLSAMEQLEEAGAGIERIRRVLDNNLRAFVEYEPVPYSAPVHLIEARDGWPGLSGRPAAAYNDGHRGWANRLPRLERHVVPGDHFTLLSHGYSEGVAKTIEDIIHSSRS